MKVTVASGKGGTGKTTLVTNLALSLTQLERVQVLDCDVEEPNSNLFLGAELTHLENIEIMTPVVDAEKCDGCGKCVRFCQYNSLALAKEKVLVFSEMCHGCGGCKLVCPQNAISEEPRTIGVVEGGNIGALMDKETKEIQTPHIEFLQGLLKPSEPMAVPIIKALKKRMWDDGAVLLDAPPGTSCPVIEALRGSDFCLLVTEPTPFGLHDLKLAVDVVRSMEIPFGVIINRDGAGNDEVRKYCSNESIRVLLSIPESMEIAKLYSDGIPFVTKMDQWPVRFQNLWSDIEKMASAAQMAKVGEVK